MTRDPRDCFQNESIVSIREKSEIFETNMIVSCSFPKQFSMPDFLSARKLLLWGLNTKSIITNFKMSSSTLSKRKFLRRAILTFSILSIAMIDSMIKPESFYLIK